ncbi:hypothetical protein M5689_021015 [Euphorbia peplus]|nr:hypothetical protein M5689_021015 [Euphorbia peplus]
MDVDDPDPRPKTSLFLGCFGFSSKAKRQDSIKISDKVHHSNSRLFRRSTLLLKQSPLTKTIPLHSEKIQRNKNSMFKFKKSKLNKNAPGDIPLKPLIPPAVKLPQETKPSFEKEVINIENGKLLDNKKGHRTPKNVSFCRRIDSIRNASSQPGSPDPNTKSNRIKISRSISLPSANPTGQPGVGIKKPGKESTSNKLDAMVGMSIIMVTLVIILIWGRLCAIICTCTWLYFIPRLRKNGEPAGQTVQNGLESEEPDFDSEEYKKRVVLVGFLERNHNRSFV